jgi:hypothetical protein
VVAFGIVVLSPLSKFLVGVDLPRHSIHSNQLRLKTGDPSAQRFHPDFSRFGLLVPGFLPRELRELAGLAGPAW